MKTLALTALLVAVATPAIAIPTPQDLNLVIPLTQALLTPAPTPLIWNYRRAEIEAMAVQAVRNGVESEFIKGAIIRIEVAKSPTRTYKYSELDRLVNSIYTAAQSKVGSSAFAKRGQSPIAGVLK